ncbi:MAG TPA: alkaline phosphatase family protein [Anaerolineaceae bacterium]|nr:alkaline phosphatase family protein [Anaerolineaceae bacterium]
MPRKKLLVFCLDALCSIDLEFIQTLPHMGAMLAQGAHVVHAEPVYPSLTYPCHVSILTGNYVARHGVLHNEIVRVGELRAPWYNQRSDIHCDTLLDCARASGFSTCSLSWPVTGGADFDLNMPMIVPMSYTGPDPIIFFQGNATPELLDKYYPRHFHHLTGPDRSLDAYTMALAPEILRDYRQPDVMLVKMCDLDTVRHAHGVDNDFVKAQLRLHDRQFGVLLDAIRQYGDYENTNFAILGDHGQSDITRTLNLNVLFKQHGLLQVDGDERLVDYDAYCHSAELSAWVRLKDPQDAALRQRVYEFLLSLQGEEPYGIGHVFTKAEAAERFHLTGPFEFIVEGAQPISFGNDWAGDDAFAPHTYKGHGTLKASHGGLPYKDQTTTFIACGPSVRPGAVVERCSIVDEAPTLAAMLGVDLGDVDGRILSEIIR